MSKIINLIILSCLLNACTSSVNLATANSSAITSSPSPLNLNNFVSDYDNDFIYPQATASVVLREAQTFPEPLHGASVSYENRFYDQDNIHVYAYPIRHFVLDHNKELLSNEVNLAFNEIDEAVKEGVYQQRIGKIVDDFRFSVNGIEYNGLRAATKVTIKSGTAYYSYTYVFQQEDKFIKFRISMPNAQSLPAPDYMVKEILPLLSVPTESQYMASLRETHRQESLGELDSTELSQLNTH